MTFEGIHRSPLYKHISWYFGRLGKQTQTSIWDHLLAVPLSYDIQCSEDFFDHHSYRCTPEGALHIICYYALRIEFPTWPSMKRAMENTKITAIFITNWLTSHIWIGWSANIGNVALILKFISKRDAFPVTMFYIFGFLGFHDLHIWSKNVRLLYVIPQTSVP